VRSCGSPRSCASNASARSCGRPGDRLPGPAGATIVEVFRNRVAAHRHASHLQRPQSGATDRGPMSPFLLPRPTARFVCGPTRFAALRLGIPRIRTGGALSYDAGVLARLTHEVEERRDAPDTARTERIAFWPRARR
jgi:hypothetical protein